MTEAWRLTATEAAAAVRDKKVSASEITKAHIARMQAVNPALNAVVVDLSQQALRDAAAADQALARGLPTGKLHGVPVTVKINIDLAGQANSNGVEALRGNIARDDSPVVSNLKKAGAIILGMTNTPEFSMRAFTDNALHGATRNPFDARLADGILRGLVQHNRMPGGIVFPQGRGQDAQSLGTARHAFSTGK